jgi:hypothetical protein
MATRFAYSATTPISNGSSASKPICAKPEKLPDVAQKACDSYDAAIGRRHFDGYHRRSYVCAFHSPRYRRRFAIGMREVDRHLPVVNWQAVATVGGMMSLGEALEKTGAARALAHALVIHFQGADANLILGVLLALTIALTQLIENAAVAIILAPIAYQIACQSHVDPKPFMVGFAICISTSFCMPIAHVTTMLVMGPGRYRFKHYLSIGSGMALIAWLLTTLVTR